MRCPAHITGLSATPTRPACPSRASGCSSLSRIGASRVACAFLVYMLPPLPRCSGWAYSTLISPSHVSLPRKGHRVGLHIVLFEACSAFTRVAACTLARSPYFVTRYPKASDISSPPCLLRLLPAGAVAGWDLHPLESAAFSRRTPRTDVPITQRERNICGTSVDNHLGRSVRKVTWNALLPKRPFYPTIWYEPDSRNEHIDSECSWRAEEGERNGRDIEQNRRNPLEVAAQRDRQV